MALIQFIQEPLNVRITKRMFAPKRHLQDPLAWYKEARKHIPEIPELQSNPIPLNGFPAPIPHSSNWWYLESEPEISVRYLKFTLVSGRGDRAHLVIDRTVPSIG